MRFGTWPTAQQSSPTPVLSTLTQRQLLLLSSPKSAEVAGNACPLALPKTAVAANFKAQFSFGLSAKSNSSHAGFIQILQRRYQPQLSPGWS